MSKQNDVFKMTVPGRIRALRMSLREAGHPRVDEYDATYLRYVAEFYGVIDGAVAALMKDGADKQS